ncbi:MULTISPECIES: ScbR family autoregulator-binding transcription factor [unclassified Cryobacterium]|uniref:ScbR family autoregulator-binding transcription factor n=1 Tax=unclassified Cryobacterium TaxID=2649013 RepID=UPI001069644D|nr:MULTISPECIES: ScbR family autoregulator-binding transcription factor [unclassified Cryobacterium]TFB96310.1 TetR/AcrR family transcriptional regulator [Cryobacterium sp. MDB2-A-1]TFC03429.1 TetR/AcrR family transcriptional regulator [Cryobacterium sp. MDB2-33-2]TFC12595.1 TetR/AcrR family transcriptional regulator [Cryobacterium sp. MDB2-A-2]TFC16987.1 TetR/AcrR family transcriptional regulator [Cryobacterium sp. MDB2-10]
MTVKQERAVLTREKIIAGAADVFYRQGFGGATLSDITAAAGVTKGALYFHFQSKEHVALAVIEAEHEIATAAATAILDTTTGPLESMLRLCSDLAGRLTTDPIVRAGIRLTTETSTFDRSMARPYEDWLATFEALTLAATEAGELRAGTDAEKLAHFIIPAFTGVQMVSDVFTERADLCRRVREMWEILLPAIVPPENQNSIEWMLEAAFPIR